MNYILTEKQGLCCHPAKRLFVVDTLPIELMGHLISEQPAQDVPGHPLHILASNVGQRRNLKGKDIFF